MGDLPRMKAYKYGKGEVIKLIEPNHLEYIRLRRTGQKKKDKEYPMLFLKFMVLHSKNHGQMLSGVIESP